MPTPLRVLVGSLAAGVLPSATTAPPDGTLLLDLGPEHPTRVGLLELRLWTDAGSVMSAEVVVGAMHRGAEKLFEVRDYRQILMLADRHDWQAPFAGELGVALACERLLGVEIPRRASWLRTLLAEHTRILSHLGFLGYVTHRLGRPSLVAELRELLRTRTQQLTGNRVHPMALRIGGLAVDADDSWLQAEVEAMTLVDDATRRLLALIDTDSFRAAALGVAPLTRGVIHGFGISGPAARASGVPLDLRRTRPYLSYDELQHLLSAHDATSADAYGRFELLAREVLTSTRLVRECRARLRDERGPVAVRLGHTVRLPEGETYVATEAPLGMAGVFVVSRGDKTPWRLKLRTPSFNHVAALEALLPGVAVAQLETALASVGYVVGDIDK